MHTGLNLVRHIGLCGAVAFAITLQGCGEPERAQTPDDYSDTLTENVSAGQRQIQAADPKTDTQKTKPDGRINILIENGETDAKSAPQPTAQIAKAGNKIDFPIRTCINVANALEAPKEGEWGYRIRQADLAAIAAAGFDTIRVPVRWDVHMQNRAPFTVDSAHMARVKEVFAQADALGLNVIINVHHYEPLMDNPRAETRRFLALWSQISTAFRGAPDSLIFEVLNEPTDKVSMATVNDLNRDAVQIIRKNHPGRWIILGGNRWNSVDSLSQLEMPRDPFIAATFHDYGPHEFTHQGAPWTGQDWPVGRKWGSRADQAELGETYDIAAKFSQTNPVPLFVGEWGVYNIVPRQERMEWMTQRHKAMDAAGYSHCVFDLSGSFSLYDTRTRTFIPGALEAIGLE